MRKNPRRHRGAVLMVMLVILILGGTAMLLNALNSSTPQLARAKVTADALAQAKEALIGYATAVELTGTNRPGDLPCPDIDNDGIKENACGSADGSTGQPNRLGRLPWKTLGLPDLRDGSGERLWYAVSNNFKEHWNTLTPLNSDTVGTITVRASDGSVLNDGSNSSGAVAIIIAAGDVLQRQGAASLQNRSCTIGVNCNTLETCTTTPPTLTPKCDPVNYLEIANGEDNANFIDSASNGFIQGRIKDGNDQVILNDHILVITRDNIMQPIQKRVAGEVKNCLDNYASAGNGRYPWATPINNISIPNYLDQSNSLFGRIPDVMNSSKSDSAPAIPAMSNQWTGSCQTHTTFTPNSWWLQWRELVFYGLSDKFKPDSSVAPNFSTTCSIPGNCLSINNTSTPAKYVVIVAGKKLITPDQSQRDFNKTNAFFYLEGGNESANQTGAYTFIQNSPSANFNDTAVYQ